MNWLLRNMGHRKGGDNPFFSLFQEYMSACNASFAHGDQSHIFGTVSEMQHHNFNMRTSGTDKLSMSICKSGLNSILYSYVNCFLILSSCSESEVAKPQLEPELLL